jgi:hypothetical protein
MKEAGYKGDQFSAGSFPLERLRGHVLELTHEADGVNFLQTILISLHNGISNNVSQQEMENAQSCGSQNKLSYFVNLMISELMTTENIFEIATSSLISYFIQKLLERCNDNELLQIVRASSPFLRQMAVDDFGTRFVQRLVEKLSSSSEHLNIIVNSLQNSDIFLPKIVPTEKNGETDCVTMEMVVKSKTFASLFFNEHSSHVIKKMLMYHPQCCNVIYCSLYQIFQLLWKKKSGCYVIQRCIEFGSDEVKGFYNLFFLISFFLSFFFFFVLFRSEDPDPHPS